MRKRFLTVLVMAVWAGAVFAQTPSPTDATPGASNGGIGMPRPYSEAELKALLDTPRVVPGTTAVVEELAKDDGGKVWIKTFSDVEMVTAVAIAPMYRALNDFANYKKNFDNSQGATVLKDAGGGRLIEAKAGLTSSLGISYIYLQTEPLSSAGERLLIRISDKGDAGDGEDDVRNMNTQYYLKTVTIDGKPCTYLRDRDYTEYRKLAVVGATQVKKFKTGDLSGHLDGLKHLAELGKKY